MVDKWQFWIDRGGTFTDIVAHAPDGRLILQKLLSENPGQYADAAIQGIKNILHVNSLPDWHHQIDCVKMGTTVATNALLERRGEPVVLVTNKGFGEALRIGYQNRPQIFALNIQLPEMLYSQVIELDCRFSAAGQELQPLDAAQAMDALQSAFDAGYRSMAILFMHGYRYPAHEWLVQQLAETIGFTHISTSHQTAPVIKLVSRGDTTCADAYLSPVLKRYIAGLSTELDTGKLFFMQSHGGLSDSHSFAGKDAIVSGPAGGIIGAVKTAATAGFSKLVTFDMGGTSTDVAHYDGQLERSTDNTIAGVRVRAPMLDIHTVAAGGGSILAFDGQRYRVGPQSAGANPGPACYHQGGPLTVTDCHVLLGRIQPKFFPAVFGSDHRQPIDAHVVRHLFGILAQTISTTTGTATSPEQAAEGYLQIAVTHMANAIKHISTQRGHDVSDYILVCFGGAGGQHACRIADELGIGNILINPLAGVLSAYGIGLADVSVVKEKTVNEALTDEALDKLTSLLQELTDQAATECRAHDSSNGDLITRVQLHLCIEGTDFSLPVALASAKQMQGQFIDIHKERYGFAPPDRRLIIQSLEVESIRRSQVRLSSPESTKSLFLAPTTTADVYMENCWRQTPLFLRQNLNGGSVILGPAIISEETATTVVEPGWQAEVLPDLSLQLTRTIAKSNIHTGNISNTTRNITATDIQNTTSGTITGNTMNTTGNTIPSGTTSDTMVSATAYGAHQKPDPILLEIFNNLFMFIAEQMGLTLQSTSHSVNIKERLDFSCALFDFAGNLIANAPHIPVHLGSMGASVEHLLSTCRQHLKPGDVYVSNDPYNGGTHLPDITVITPVFSASSELLFFVASRGHHADIGGISPGSMPPFSKDIGEEGIIFDNFVLVENGQFREQPVREVLEAGKFPSRNVSQNIADLKAQIAANNRGVQELSRLIETYGLDTVRAYMNHVQENACELVRQVIDNLQDGSFSCPMDNGATINVSVKIDRQSRTATIDFEGTSKQQADNFNAPKAVCTAAVLYVFRTLVNDDIPLNAGCLRPLQIVIPEGSMLNPQHPAAVVAGNVETSQIIVDCLYGALGVLAASQGTMNNFTFGNDHYQYYETIAGGSGAGSSFDGADAVQSHMTNSRLTDPEVLESRFPVLLESFAVRQDSGGQGQFRGGNGVTRRIRFLEPMTAGILSGRRSIAPHGIAGGAPGATGQNTLIAADGKVHILKARDQVEVQSGDTIVIETPGGGGFGS